VKDTENMAEQRTADVRTVGWSLRQKEILGIVLDVIQSLRSSALGCLEIVVDSVVAVFFRCWRACFSLFSELILSGIEF
jgi:hypothetical protein